MQVFYWTGPGAVRDNKTYYQSFQLNGVDYTIGDTVYLYPEQESHPHYIGRIVSAFVDEHSGHADPHCIQVKWFERRVNLEESTRGIEESEKEVFELEDVDINPIGCISGKNIVVKSRCFDDARERMRSSTVDWYFCRGYFIQTTNSFQPYTDVEMGMVGIARGRAGGAADEQESAPVQPAAISKNSQQAAGAKRKVTGRVCVQCGATSTPQWREGPTGPKTLCNACGVRYNRAQQKAQKRNQAATAGASSRGQAGRGTAATSPGGRGKKGGVGAADAGIRADHRPVRQAAQVALARTSAYARTGEFPDQEPGLEGGEGMYGQPGAMPMSSLEMQLGQGPEVPQDATGLDSTLLYTGSQARTAAEQAGVTLQRPVLRQQDGPGYGQKALGNNSTMTHNDAGGEHVSGRPAASIQLPPGAALLVDTDKLTVDNHLAEMENMTMQGTAKQSIRSYVATNKGGCLLQPEDLKLPHPVQRAVGTAVQGAFQLDGVVAVAEHRLPAVVPEKPPTLQTAVSTQGPSSYTPSPAQGDATLPGQDNTGQRHAIIHSQQAAPHGAQAHAPPMEPKPGTCQPYDPGVGPHASHAIAEPQSHVNTVPVQNSAQTAPHAKDCSSVRPPHQVQQVANGYQAIAALAGLQQPALQELQPLFAKHMTPEVARVLAAVQLKVDAAHNNAALAEAAACAVLQMYQTRHAEAQRARHAAAVARQQLQQYLVKLTSAHAQPGYAARHVGGSATVTEHHPALERQPLQQG